MDHTLRRATPADAELLVDFIRQLADFENLSHEVRADAARLRAHLAARPPACEAVIAEVNGTPVGFALFFATYSTFWTEICMHLEDLFVVPPARGKGIGRALLAAVAEAAIERECPRLQWNVLDWNHAAIGFYERSGATVLADWRVCRVDGDALASLAES